ncbi:MAG: ThuA domain-containing protein [Bryobacteraceae bacterium]|nr:ThuA domain-containing protein [Bryobacteraceae bacterium]
MRIVLGALLACSLWGAEAPPKLRALIVDGVNNHDWQAGTAGIRRILEGSGRFTVDVSTSPERGAPAAEWEMWRPAFAQYDVVVNNFNGGHLADGLRWPAEVESAWLRYLRGGGGVVIFHAANNAFLEWPEYQEMVGLLWREPKFGPGLIVNARRRVETVPAGEGPKPGHGPRHDFEVEVLDPQHPITLGLPAKWMHPSEQLTHGQHGPAEGLKVLTFAYSKDSRRNEPMDWVRRYGRGRVYVTMLGHTWRNEPNPNFDDPNFQMLLARGAEWAATGKVAH